MMTCHRSITTHWKSFALSLRTGVLLLHSSYNMNVEGKNENQKRFCK